MKPKTKVIQNFSVIHSDDVDIIKENLISQLYSPVRWSETMLLFKESNITEFYECGPSKVLTGLIKKQFVICPKSRYKWQGINSIFPVQGKKNVCCC